MITQSRGSEVLLKGSLVGVPTYCLNEKKKTLSSARHFFIEFDLIAYNNIMVNCADEINRYFLKSYYVNIHQYIYIYITHILVLRLYYICVV